MTAVRRRRRSRLRIVDSIGESWLEVTRRPGRAVLTGLGVALSAAAIVTTLTLTATIRFQVSDQFDARRATQVELRARTETGGPVDIEFPPPPEAVERVERLSGVVGVAVIRQTFEDQRVAINRVDDPTAASTPTPIYGLSSDSLASLEARIQGPAWQQWHDDTAQRVVVLSRSTAAAIGAGDIAVGDRLYIAGMSFTVAGILDQAPRLPALTNGLIIPTGTIALFDIDTDRDRLIVVTAPGAAQQVATVLSRAVTPADPDIWTAYAPQDEATLRRTVDDQLQALSLGLGVAVLVLGVVSIGNATLTSVMQRIHEIGLRRALGARPPPHRHPHPPRHRRHRRHRRGRRRHPRSHCHPRRHRHPGMDTRHRPPDPTRHHRRRHPRRRHRRSLPRPSRQPHPTHRSPPTRMTSPVKGIEGLVGTLSWT